ncbi:hypothetical protein AVO45_06020 [Ruegeria marisrubri]|uniref:Uncharacterized protein n=1 Tax=Ruegeria marisrubri TaxID=1685379 RepID=A0A0X3TY78_9RHOB|nr:hypothetical protein AVO45_06020 [Ruegeria marisrubri]
MMKASYSVRKKYNEGSDRTTESAYLIGRMAGLPCYLKLNCSAFRIVFSGVSPERSKFAANDGLPAGGLYRRRRS